MALPRYIPHYGVPEYQTWEGHWELWSGVPVSMSPSPDRVHQRLARRVVTQLDSALRAAGCDHCEVLFALDWIVSEDTVFRPDVVVTCDGGVTQWIEAAPRLVVEILSPSTRARDLLYKREAYASLGVLYYLMVDPESAKATLLENVENGFEEMQDATMLLASDCRLTLKLDGLFELPDAA